MEIIAILDTLVLDTREEGVEGILLVVEVVVGMETFTKIVVAAVVTDEAVVEDVEDSTTTQTNNWTTATTTTTTAAVRKEAGMNSNNSIRLQLQIIVLVHNVVNRNASRTAVGEEDSAMMAEEGTHLAEEEEKEVGFEEEAVAVEEADPEEGHEEEIFEDEEILDVVATRHIAIRMRCCNYYNSNTNALARKATAPTTHVCCGTTLSCSVL
jgi:hypothetical protein